MVGVYHPYGEEDVLERAAWLLGARALDERLGGVGPLRVLELQIGQRLQRLGVGGILRQDRLELVARAIAILELVAGDARLQKMQRHQLAAVGLDLEAALVELGQRGEVARIVEQPLEARERLGRARIG